MAHYLVKLDGKKYASEELFIDAVAGGERSLIKLLSKKEVIAKPLMDFFLYPLTPEQLKKCEGMDLEYQDFDSFYTCLNILPKDEIEKQKKEAPASVLTVGPAVPLLLYKFKKITFLKAETYKKNSYHLMPRLASIKLCGRHYIALNAVNIECEKPIIVTLREN